MIIFGLKVTRSEERKMQGLNERMNEWTYQFSDQQVDTALLYIEKLPIIIGNEEIGIIRDPVESFGIHYEKVLLNRILTAFILEQQII